VHSPFDQPAGAGCRCCMAANGRRHRRLFHLSFRRTPMKFRFPIVIIDEDFRSENTSGLGIRALAGAIEAEGVEVLGVTSYGDLSSFAQQQSRASAFILSIDDEEFDVDSPEDVANAIKNL